MKFTVQKNESGTPFVQINEISCACFIDNRGLQLNSTIYRQDGIDYNYYDKVKIIGVDLLYDLC